MSYGTAGAFRTALEARLRNESESSGISLDRLRRRVVFQRIVARLQRDQPGQWVVKGGMAMEVRLKDQARLTKDLDLGLREIDVDAKGLRDRLIEALTRDDYEDRFVFAVGVPTQLSQDGGGHVTWRASVEARLAGRRFGAMKLDVSPRVHELHATDLVRLPNALEFAGVPATDVEIVAIHRHAAEKLHGMSKRFVDRDNTRVRDLVDVMLMVEAGLVIPDELSGVVQEVWMERDRVTPPPELPALPTSWAGRYARLATDNGVHPRSFDEAVAAAAALWAELFPKHDP